MKKQSLLLLTILLIIFAAVYYQQSNRVSKTPTSVPQNPTNSANPIVQNQSPQSADNPTPSSSAADQNPVGNTTAPSSQLPATGEPANSANPQTPSSNSSVTNTNLSEPISSALQRVIKKPFGIKVSPTDSPVQPERFTGYHTGTDFEILPGEENIDVPIYAACDGTAVYKNYVSGYGGVFIQSCKIQNQDVTVLYGHLKLASINNKSGNKIKAGDKIAILGKGYSTETDGERKHLHLGIHLGTKIELRGYVQTKAELGGWLDAMKYLGVK